MHDYVILDVFTREPLRGNPVAVFLDSDGLDTATMQATARELNLSETVFLGPGDPDHDASLRIFTPGAELPFAGHPVLGAAFVVGARDGLAQVRLRTGAGTVPVSLTRSGSEIVFGEMDQPLPAEEAVPDERRLLEALGVTASRLPVAAFRNGPVHVYVGLEAADAVHRLAPDLRALSALGDFGVSCFAVEPSHVEVRYFIPGLGVPEDPATGSAAGPLALHLARAGVIGWGEEIDIHQGTAMGRASRLRARVEGDERALRRVVVGGGAVRVAEGRYRLGRTEPAR